MRIKIKKIMENNIYYSARLLLSYKRLYNMVVGIRGHGKTYDTTKRCIDVGLETKKLSFVVLVRYKEDILYIKDSWWSIVEHLYPEYRFFAQRRYIYATEIKTNSTFIIGEYVALSDYMRVKKTPRPYVKIIFFDEFLNEENDYINDEVSKNFMSVCDSIIRNREDVRVILVSNTISMINPYYSYFGIKRLTGRFTKGEHNSIVEFTDSEKFREYRKGTKFGSTIVGTSYGDYALSGAFLLDDMTNVIEKPPVKTKHYLFNIVLDENNIEVNMMNGLLYFSKSNDYSRRSYTPYVENAKTYNSTYVEKTFRYFKMIQKYFMLNKVMYQSLIIKNAIIEFMQYLNGSKYNGKQK